MDEEGNSDAEGGESSQKPRASASKRRLGKVNPKPKPKPKSNHKHKSKAQSKVQSKARSPHTGGPSSSPLSSNTAMGLDSADLLQTDMVPTLKCTMPVEDPDVLLPLGSELVIVLTPYREFLSSLPHALLTPHERLLVQQICNSSSSSSGSGSGSDSSAVVVVGRINAVRMPTPPPMIAAGGGGHEDLAVAGKIHCPQPATSFV